MNRLKMVVAISASMAVLLILAVVFTTSELKRLQMDSDGATQPSLTIKGDESPEPEDPESNSSNAEVPQAKEVEKNILPYGAKKQREFPLKKGGRLQDGDYAVHPISGAVLVFHSATLFVHSEEGEVLFKSTDVVDDVTFVEERDTVRRVIAQFTNRNEKDEYRSVADYSKDGSLAIIVYAKSENSVCKRLCKSWKRSLDHPEFDIEMTVFRTDVQGKNDVNGMYSQEAYCQMKELLEFVEATPNYFSEFEYSGCDGFVPLPRINPERARTIEEFLLLQGISVGDFTPRLRAISFLEGKRGKTGIRVSRFDNDRLLRLLKEHFHLDPLAVLPTHKYQYH